MTNLLGTEAGRNEQRRRASLVAQGRNWKRAKVLFAALDGLDIAESYFRAKAEREAHIDCYPCLRLEHPCPVAQEIIDRRDSALAEWQAWGRGELGHD